jgi:hypothetical protein
MMKKAKSSYDLAPNPNPDLKLKKFKNPLKYQSSSELYLPSSPMACNNNDNKRDDGGKHKVVIYFSDAYNNICNNKANGAKSNIDHATRLANEMQSKTKSSENLKDNHSTKDFIAQLKTVLEDKQSKFPHKFENFSSSQKGLPRPVPPLKKKPMIPEKPTNIVQINQPGNSLKQMNGKSCFGNEKLLPSFIESIDENNVIKLKIEQNFKKASELVDLISSIKKKKKKRTSEKSNETSSIHELDFSHEDDEDEDDDELSEPDEGYFYDWSFVQEWRSR